MFVCCKASKVENIKALDIVFLITLEDAKSAVHFYEVWKDVKKQDEKFPEDLIINLGIL